MPYKQSNFVSHLRVGNRDMGLWAESEGGGLTTEEAMYTDWDGDVQLGGRATREQATLRKLYREDVHQQFRFLNEATIRGDRIVWTKTPVGDDGVAWGDPIVRTGVIAGVAEPDMNKGSSEGGTISVTLNLDAPLA